jgi:hypothetical protein
VTRPDTGQAQTCGCASAAVRHFLHVTANCCDHSYRSVKLFSRTTLPGFERVCAKSVVNFVCAVQWPEQRASPEWPLHVPRPELLESLPEPEANLS